MSYIAIVSQSLNRITKFSEFDAEADADAHVLIYGGFVYENSNNMAVQSIWIDGETVSEKSLVSLSDYKKTVIEVNRKETGRRIALLFGTVEDGYAAGSDKLKWREINMMAEALNFSFKIQQGTSNPTERQIVSDAQDLLGALQAIREAKRSVATEINAVSDSGDLVADKITIDNITVSWPQAALSERIRESNE